MELRVHTRSRFFIVYFFRELYSIILNLRNEWLWGVFLLTYHVACRGRSQRGLESWEEGAEPKIQPRAQNTAQGLVGHLPRIFESQNYESPSENESKVQEDLSKGVVIKKLEEQLLGRASYYSSAGSSLKHSNFSKKWLNHIFLTLLLISATRPVTNNKLVETKRWLTWWERVNSDETCMRVREKCV